WQIQVYVHNFQNIGIPADDIHVLLQETENREILEFCEMNKDKANFFFYPDTRTGHNYAPTIRPHLLKKHFDKYPWLESERLFYHDADIIFREKLDESVFKQNDDWYLSNTTEYIGIEHLNSFGFNILSNLCRLVDLPVSAALNNRADFGGAQYVIKGVCFAFCDKHEIHCEATYNYIKDNKPILEAPHNEGGFNRDVNFQKLQEWCADMWSMVLNGIYFGFNLKIVDELNFCWPHQGLEKWRDCKILHNAGVTAEQSEFYFYKSKYINYTPFEDHELEKYDFTKCTIKYVDAIKSARKCLLKSLEKSSVIFVPESECTREQIEVQVSYLEKYFCNYDICVYLEGSATTRFDCIPDLCIINNLQQLLDFVENSICIVINPVVIFKYRQFYEAFLEIKLKRYELIIPYDVLIPIENKFMKE